MSANRRCTVTAVTPTHNNLKELCECLASLQAQLRPPEQIFVCVDGSTDGTLEYLTRASVGGPARVRTLTHAANARRGRAATRNLALDSLTTDFVWYVDSDMILAPDALQHHLALAESRRCVSQGQVRYANAQDARWAGYLSTRAHHRAADGATIPFTWYTTANSLVRASHVKALGGFDARFAGYGGEDIDFAYRLIRATGEPIINNRRAVASTVEGKSLEQAMSELEEYGSTNLHLLESLHPDMPRTFELQRLGSAALSDRIFVALLQPPFEWVVDFVVRVGPNRLRNRFLNYKVVSAVWRGYRSSSAGKHRYDS